jgi:hypothetical protein
LAETVAGIGIIRSFCVFLHPIRIRLEEEVEVALKEYIFTDRTMKRREEISSTPDYSLSRSQSSTTIATLATTNGRGRHNAAETHLRDTVPDVDAAEMRMRAKANRTFVAIVVGSTAFVLDYKRDDKRKHHGLVIPECADFRLMAPRLEYLNEILTFKELFDKVKSDIWSSAWQQKGDIINQVFKKTSMFRSKKSLRQIAGISTDVVPSWTSSSKGRAAPKSPLRFTVQSTPPPEADEMGYNVPNSGGPGMFRSLSRKSDGNGTVYPSQGHVRRTSVASSASELDVESHHGSGLLGKLRKHTHKHDHIEILDDVS